MLSYRLPVLAVQDVEASKQFYSDLFGQKVVLDLGKNVTFSGGFAIQEDFPWLTDVDPASVVRQPHNMELYFEADDFDGFLRTLDAFDRVRLVHPPKKHDWQQRVVRLYDPDGHMIEVGESMEVIAVRYLAQGLSVEETAKRIQHPVEFVRMCAEKRKLTR